MKKLIIFLSLVLAAATLAGCTAASGSPLNTPVPPSSTKFPIAGITMEPLDPYSLEGDKPDMSGKKIESLYWDSFRVAWEGSEKLETKIFTDGEVFAEEFDPEKRGLNDRYGIEQFEKVFVVAVFLTANTGGWDYELVSAHVKGGTVYIDVNGVKPSGEATQALERHVLLVAFDAKYYSEDLFVSVSMNGKPLNGKISDSEKTK